MEPFPVPLAASSPQQVFRQQAERGRHRRCWNSLKQSIQRREEREGNPEPVAEKSPSNKDSDAGGGSPLHSNLLAVGGLRGARRGAKRSFLPDILPKRAHRERRQCERITGSDSYHRGVTICPCR